MIDHGQREHATWSASSTARNWHCPGALALTHKMPETSNKYADYGTAGHQIAERCLRDWTLNAIDFLDTEESVKGRKVFVDEELCNSTQEFINYVRAAAGQHGSHLQIEQRFSLADLNPPFDAGGTGDAVVHHSNYSMLEVIDFKNGRGVVDAKGNPQLRTYGLGAVLANPTLDVETVKVTIVQPRAGHKDGSIRSETFHMSELIEWTADLVDAMHRSKQALDEYEAAGFNTILLDEWRDKWLKPGKCTFCPAEGVCPAQRRDALAVAQTWADEDNQMQIGNAALDTSPEALARDLDNIPMLEEWIKARRSYAHRLAEQGTEIPGYQLSEKIGNRKWTDDTDLLIVALRAEGATDAEIHVDPKLKSPAQIEKLFGKTRAEKIIKPFVHRPVTGTNLVSVAKTTRPPAPSAAEKWAETEKE